MLPKVARAVSLEGPRRIWEGISRRKRGPGSHFGPAVDIAVLVRFGG